MERYVATDDPHLVKDTETGVVLNNDKNGYENYLAQRAANEAKRLQAQTMEQEIDSMKEDIAEIVQESMKNVLFETGRTAKGAILTLAVIPLPEYHHMLVLLR